jgi:hypothetical protein
MSGEGKNRMKSARMQLVGRWLSSDSEARVVYCFSRRGRGVSMSVFDEADQESFVVRRQRWRGNWLHFDLLVPSANWHTRNRIKLVSPNRLICEFTYQEEWERNLESRPPTENAISPITSSNLVGQWRSKNHDCPVTLEITKSGKHFAVQGYDAIAKQNIRLSIPRRNRASLRFDAHALKGDYVCSSTLTPLSHRTLVHEITMRDALVRIA